MRLVLLCRRAFNKMIMYRNARPWTLAVAILVTIALFLGMRQAYWEIAWNASPTGHSTLPRSPIIEAKTLQAAGNSTLGFHKIVLINMKHRYDRTDAAALQAYVSGVEFEEYAAIEADSIKDPGGPGMPPASGGPRSRGELACFRSHGNVWSEVVQKRLPPVLILEADAVWDVDIRAIMANMNRNFVEYLHELKSQPAVGPHWRKEVPSGFRGQPVEFNQDDPWLSEHWDIIGFGHCMEHQDTIPEGPNRVYKDPTVPPGYKSQGMTLGKERIIRRSGATACTAGYAVSHRGAAKMLMRNAMDFNDPVDLIMGNMMKDKSLVSYTITPPTIGQWEYVEGIGMDHARSDIHGKEKEKEEEMTGWDDARKKHSVWRVSPKYGKIIKNSALDLAWGKIFSLDAPFTMPSILGANTKYTEAKEKPEGAGAEDQKEEENKEKQ